MEPDPSLFLAASPGMRVITFTDRYARPESLADLPSLRALYERGEMRGDGLALRYDRGEDFFRFLEWQGDDGLLLYYRRDAEPVRAIGSITYRHAWTDGKLTRIAYLQDLRTDSGREVTRSWRRSVADFVVAHAATQGGARYHLAAVFRGNAVGLKTMARGLGPKVVADVVADYDIVQIVGRLWPKTPDHSPYTVRAARADEEGALVELLDRCERTKAFGFAFADEEWARRKARWPGFSVESFRVVADATGRIRACTLPWSPAAGKQVFVQRLPRGLRVVRRLVNASTRWHGLALPADGEPLRALYLTHLAVDPDLAQDDKIKVFSALTSAVHREHVTARPGRWSTISFAESAGSTPWSKGLKGYVLQKTPAVLLAIRAPSTPAAPRAGAAGVGIELAIV